MMPRTRPLLLLSAILAVAACGDQALTAPASPIATSAAEFARASAAPSNVVAAVQILKRTKPLPASISTSGLIGPNGGRLSIPDAGVELDFAPGAVRRRMRITVTAAKGADVVYEFQPHGLKFHAPVVVRQDLKRTSAESDSRLAASLQGSYFEGDLASNLIGTRGVYAHIKEGRAARLSGASRFLDFSIQHFSGYMLSTGFVAVDVTLELGEH